MTTHQLKCHPSPFAAVWAGLKKAEIRSTADRTFWTEDRIELQEFIGNLNYYTGRTVRARITHIQEGYGLPDGMAMLSFKVLKRLVGNNHYATESNP